MSSASLQQASVLAISQAMSRSFPGTAASVPQARHWLRALLDDLPAAADAMLCLSELATNAIEHSRSGQPGGTFTVRVRLHPVICVEVSDQGGPLTSRRDPDGLRGRGLTIVAELADDSGIGGDENGRTAWFVLSGCAPGPNHRVELPRTDGMRLVGIGMRWPATPEGRCIHAISTWLTGLERRAARAVLVTKISRDLWPLLEAVPLRSRALHSSFDPSAEVGSLMPGHVTYLGAGAVRLDAAALSALAKLPEGEDFRVVTTAGGPVMIVGSEYYPAREESDSAP